MKYYVGWENQKESPFFEVDFEKAFDSVCWSFLDDIMRQMDFPHVWRKWIYNCVSSARTSILINGSPTFEFNVTWGLQQGDPLSPFLFLTMMEALHLTMDVKKDWGILLPNDGPHISHLFFCGWCTLYRRKLNK